MLICFGREQGGDLGAGPEWRAARGRFEHRVICGVAEPDGYGAKLLEAGFDCIDRMVSKCGFQL